MTDEQIIRGLEHIVEIAKDIGDVHSMMINIGSIISALDLINRQKAEIEKKDTEIEILIRKKEALRDEISELTAEVERLSNFVSEERCREIAKEMFPPVVAKAKTEAYGEFAELLKRYELQMFCSFPNTNIGTQCFIVLSEEIDNTLKELTEEK